MFVTNKLNLLTADWTNFRKMAPPLRKIKSDLLKYNCFKAYIR